MNEHPDRATQQHWLYEAVKAAVQEGEQSLTNDEALRMLELETFEWRQQRAEQSR